MPIECKIYSYETPFFDGQTRKGFLIKLSDGAQSSWGEASPLPGRSRESLEDVLKELINAKNLLETSSEPFSDCIEKKWSPSVSFALLSAIESMKQPIAATSLPLAPLLQGDYEEIRSKAKELLKCGHTHAKLKTGGLSSKETKMIIDELKGTVRLRIDCNRSLSLAQARELFEDYHQDAFDYLEEPCCNILDSLKLGHPIALDETLSEREIDEIPLGVNIKALVIKPTMLGYKKCKALADLAKRSSLAYVLSGCYETGIGLARAAELPFRLSTAPCPVGFDTYSYMIDILAAPHFVSNGRIVFSTALPSPHLIKETQYV